MTSKATKQEEEAGVIYERYCAFGMSERGSGISGRGRPKRITTRRIGAVAWIYRDGEGVLSVHVRPTRNDAGFGATKARVYVHSVDEANAEIARRITAMFNRYAKTSDRWSTTTVEDCVKRMHWDGAIAKSKKDNG